MFEKDVTETGVDPGRDASDQKAILGGGYAGLDQDNTSKLIFHFPDLLRSHSV
jgi:hypothetical protein